jgi:hypothetical protein
MAPLADDVAGLIGALHGRSLLPTPCQSGAPCIGRAHWPVKPARVPGRPR